MRVGVLFSGGKDSNYALYKASQKHEISCIITMVSENSESYMFQTPGIDSTQIQAKALQIPQIRYKTKGEKEKELIDLFEAVKFAKEKYKIEGIVSGAINSAYQASRIQNICKNLDLWSFNPLWQKDQVKFLKELIDNKFKVIIVGVCSYPLNKNYLGKTIDEDMISKLINMQKKYHINPAGEGGEIETFVIDSPIFKKKINIKKTKIEMDSENSGNLIIKEAELLEK